MATHTARRDYTDDFARYDRIAVVVLAPLLLAGSFLFGYYGMALLWF